MTAGDPATQVFWLAGRALGIVAVVALSLSVTLGLAMFWSTSDGGLRIGFRDP